MARIITKELALKIIEKLKAQKVKSKGKAHDLQERRSAMADHCSRARTLVAVILLCAACFTSPFLRPVNGQEKEPAAVAEAMVLVIAKTPEMEKAAAWRGHLVVLRTPLILDRAIKKGDLATLKSFAKVADPAAAIQAGLSATADPSSDTSHLLIKLTFRGASADDSVKVLAAIIESYRESLFQDYQNVSAEVARLVVQSRDIVENRLTISEEKFREFRLKNGRSLSKEEKDISTERLGTLERKKTELLLRKTELCADLKQTEGDSVRAGFQIEVHQWAKSTGFDQLPKSIQEKGQVACYKEHLKEKLDRLIAVEKAVDELVGDENKKRRALDDLEKQDEVFRQEIARNLQLLDTTSKRLNEINILRDFHVLTMHVISPPKGKKDSR
jgi:hypothetical protein